MHKAGGIVVFDYATAAPYVKVNFICNMKMLVDLKLLAALDRHESCGSWRRRSIRVQRRNIFLWTQVRRRHR
jgi:hypothetical protein